MEIFKIKTTRDFGSLISHSFLYVSRHFKSLGKSILYFVVPLILLTLIFTYQYLTAMNTVDPANFNPAAFLGSFSATFILGMLTSAALATVVLTHLKLVANNHKENNSISVNDIWEGVKSNFLVVLLLNIVVAIISGIGFLLFIIPGIFISVKLSLVTAVYIIEEKDFGESFSRSWNLIKNNWWITFSLFIVMVIMIALMAYGVTLPFLLVGYVLGFVGLGDPATTFQTINSGIVGPLSNILYALLYIGMGLQYFNLVERKEGKGLSERIDDITQELD